jgi:putative signal transducing protein
MYLESHGVQALVFDAQSYTYAEGALVGVRVMVLDEDLAEARRVLRDYEP